MWFMKKILFKTYLCTHCLSIPVREFWSVQAWWSSGKLINAHVRGAVCTLVWCFKRKRNWRSWYHDLESIRHDLESLCSDNDLRCHMRKIKIISSDWIAILRRLSIHNYQHFFWKLIEASWSKLGEELKPVPKISVGQAVLSYWSEP